MVTRRIVVVPAAGDFLAIRRLTFRGSSARSRGRFGGAGGQYDSEAKENSNYHVVASEAHGMETGWKRSSY